MVVVSSGPSSALDLRVPRTPTVPANNKAAKKSRRLCTIAMDISLRSSGVHDFAAPASWTEHPKYDVSVLSLRPSGEECNAQARISFETPPQASMDAGPYA
jgi:hypothetical protein